MFICVYLLLLVQILVHGINVEIRECDDCMLYSSCEGARVLASAQRSTNLTVLFKNSLCGLKYDGEEKVCCSDFPNPKLALLPSSCTEIDYENSSSGREAALYEFPWMTLIAQDKFGIIDFVCTGTIINSLYILTAAHCVNNKKITSVRVGEHDTRKKADCQGIPPNIICESHIQNIGVAEVIIHEHYYVPANNLHIALHDIALLRLKKHIDLTHRNVEPICLPMTRELLDVPLAGSYGIVPGWGQTETGYGSPVMLKVELPIQSESECQNTLQTYADVLPSEKLMKICAGAFGKDSCEGDSGGPLLIEQGYKERFTYVQYGIVSQGSKRCGSGLPGIYTDVRKYIDWILENIKV